MKPRSRNSRLLRRRQKRSRAMRWIVVGSVAPALSATGLHIMGVLHERLVATSLVVAFALGGAAFMQLKVWKAARCTRERVFGAVVVAMVGFMAAVPVIGSLFPGKPLLTRTVRGASATIAVGRRSTGRVRILVSGALRRGVSGPLAFSISGTVTPIRGVLPVARRRSSRSAGTTVLGRPSVYVPAVIAPGTRQLTINRLKGDANSPLAVAVYRLFFPHWLYMSMLTLAAMLVFVVDARLGLRAHVAVVATACLFMGFYLRGTITPTHAAGPVIVALLPSIALGAALGMVGSAAAKSLIGKTHRRPVRQKKRQDRWR